ncbi:GTP cyclohydrolase I FolE [Campylobacter geochelonis]|uniref:GTP cyclohydrolase 1 n=1 Tax=Campylobacter geochelonis TaxID=1780362 RepID=A0A128EAY3_9BACT|nr:GTP cyclohydrolase I FolE [Campylobacter geochelonis]QKF70514.1 GTP cyclohydrolase I [Campylobacter geochelonis]CZE46130.1 GTP cyclohydrolase I [Campylobacter geochelonis]CZE46503.1 GTP cyclohydrolase I [Campylobacter geochelonis]CZE50444.1 GTP cyclohydrolase I [Campylobacter geochelonis]
MDKDLKQENFEKSVKNMLELLGEDPNREGLLKTPNRVFKAYEFMTSGYSQDPKIVLNDALFESSNNEMVLIKDIEFYSLCEHHLLPIIGRAHVAYIPNGKVVGLSKIPRMVNIFARRLQIQEQMTEQIAQAIQEVIKPKGVGVVLQARHMCVEMRGVEKINSTTTTSALRGSFISDSRTRKEFFSLINSPRDSRF